MLLLVQKGTTVHIQVYKVDVGVEPTAPLVAHPPPSVMVAYYVMVVV